MGFYFFFSFQVGQPAMLDKFPKAFALIFINNTDPSTYWFFDGWPILRIFISWVFLLKLCDLIGSIEDDGDVCIRESHVAIRLDMMNP